MIRKASLPKFISVRCSTTEAPPSSHPPHHFGEHAACIASGSFWFSSPPVRKWMEQVMLGKSCAPSCSFTTSSPLGSPGGRKHLEPEAGTALDLLSAMKAGCGNFNPRKGVHPFRTEGGGCFFLCFGCPFRGFKAEGRWLVLGFLGALTIQAAKGMTEGVRSIEKPRPLLRRSGIESSGSP